MNIGLHSQEGDTSMIRPAMSWLVGRITAGQIIADRITADQIIATQITDQCHKLAASVDVPMEACFGHVCGQERGEGATNRLQEVAAYVDFPMGAYVGTRLGQETLKGTPFTIVVTWLVLTSLWERMWGHVWGKKH